MKTLGRVAIIGAGPTALGAAYRLKELGQNNFVVYEASGVGGGLASSRTDERGFTWDIGGHVLFSHYPYFDQLMDRIIPAEDWLHHQRESWIRVRNRFIPYPFQCNLHRLPEEDMRRCLDAVGMTQVTDAGKG